MAPSSNPIAKTRIRPAEPADIDAITKCMIAFLSSDKIWSYRFPHREQYPEDYLKFSRLHIELMVSGQFPDLHTLILEVEDEDDDIWNIAAVSIWDCSYVNRRLFAARGEVYNPPNSMEIMNAAGLQTRRDKNPIYDAAFLKAVSDARNEFTALFSENHIYLNLIGTHPDYRRRSYATKLLGWGIERAEQDGVPLVLCASPMGEPTYLKSGFEEVGRNEVVVEGKGEYERMQIVKMVYRPGRGRGEGKVGGGD